MSDLIDRQAAIDALTRKMVSIPTAGEKDLMGDVNRIRAEDISVIRRLPSAQPETHEERTETHACDYINRKDAIDAHYEYCNKHPDAGFPVWSLKILEDLPSAQPEPLDEWCTDCREYDKERHCCPRFNKVIRETVEEYKAELQWNNHTVACLLADLYGDPCACNYNDISEWLPEKCEVIDSCPNPVGVACWEQFLKHRAERRTDDSISD